MAGLLGRALVGVRRLPQGKLPDEHGGHEDERGEREGRQEDAEQLVGQVEERAMTTPNLQ